MSEIIYYFLTVLMFLDCVILILLVLAQLPKKEAGAGMAFGGGATDALFGAGSGNVLTRITKYSAGIFFILALLMAMISAHTRKASGGEQLVNELSKQSSKQLAPGTPSGAPAAASPGGGGLLQGQLFSNVPPAQATGTNAAAGATARPATNAPAAPATPAATNK